MTRPRQPIAPAMAGAVDLSALKQRATAPPAGPGDAAAPAVATAVTEVNFEAEVITRSDAVPVVVVLWSARSDASVALIDSLAALAVTDAGRWSLTTVDVDSAPRVGQIFGVQAVPTVVALAAGQPLSSFQGSQPPEQLRRWIDSLLDAVAGTLPGGAADEAPAADPELERARDLLDVGDFDGAGAAYEAIAVRDSTHAEAKGALRQIGFLRRATATGHDAVAIADASPADIDAALAAADTEVLHQRPDAAFARLTALVRSTAGDDRTRVRTRLIELFELFDPADPAVIAGRRNLANALY